MGMPKSLMQVDGQPWWTWQHRTLTGYHLDPYWVVSTHVTAAMDRHGSAPDRLVIAAPDAPMFASVLLGLAAVDDLRRGAFILPVDTPAPGLEHWRSLADSTCPAHPSYKGKGGHPLYLPFGWIHDRLQERLARVRTQGLLTEDHADRLDKLIEPVARRLPVDDPAVTLNLNTPAELDDWRQMLRQ